MIEPPAGPPLLDAARKTLLEQVLPALPAEQRYAALMIANAMAIASRVARRDPAAEAALGARAAALAVPLAAPGADPGTDPWAALAAAIRAGLLDPGTPAHAAGRALLRDYVDIRCALSAPKALRPRREGGRDNVPA